MNEKIPKLFSSVIIVLFQEYKEAYHQHSLASEEKKIH